MSNTLDAFIERLIHLQVRLLNCQARMAAGTDPRALHDLRTALRRLRSLLRPLQGLPGIDRLEEAVRASRRETTLGPDPEQSLTLLRAAQPDLLPTYARLAKSEPLAHLLRLLDTFVPLLRANAQYGAMGKLERRICKALARQARRLRRALASPHRDGQRLHRLIKEVREGAQAYPERISVSREADQALRHAQKSLVRWRAQWKRVNGAGQHATLPAQRGQEQAELQQAEHLADQALARLRKIMGKPGSLNTRKK